jgi:hypothetical protein
VGGGNGMGDREIWRRYVREGLDGVVAPYLHIYIYIYTYTHVPIMYVCMYVQTWMDAS